MLKTMNNPLGKWYFNEPSSFLSIQVFVEEFFDKYVNVYFIVMRVALSRPKWNKHDCKCFQEPRLVGTLPSQHFPVSNGGRSFHRDDFVRLNTLEIVI